MLTSEVAVVKSHHDISVKYSQYRDTGPTNPSQLLISSLWGFLGCLLEGKSVKKYGVHLSHVCYVDVPKHW